MRKKTDIGLLIGAAALLMLTAVSMLLVPAADREGTVLQQGLSLAVGILFWIGLIGGLALWAVVNVRYHNRPRERKIAGRPGIVCFFTSKPAALVDILLFISFVMNLVCGIGHVGGDVFAAVWASLLIASFHLHYILNGKVYRCLTGGQMEARGRSRRKSADGKENKVRSKVNVNKATGGTQ